MANAEIAEVRVEGIDVKWSKRGHELDAYAYGLTDNFGNKGKRIAVFGAGVIGEEIRAVIEKTGCFAGFIDNDKEKQMTGMNGVRVRSLQEFLREEKKGLIVIAADKKHIPVITEQLIDEGLKKGIDFYEYKEFMEKVFPVLSVYANGQMYVELAQICLTERCTLKCRKCAHACYAVGAGSQDMSIETAKKSADYFFSHVDIVKEFVLIGGEPFLYQNLGEIIEYIGVNYRDQIVIFSITTNGTIMPNQEILNVCEKYRVTIRISDYSLSIRRLEVKYERLRKVLEDRQIAYTISEKETQWMDYGFESVDRKGGEEELIRVFDECKTPCREIRGSRYYYCVMARSVSDNLKWKCGAEDYLDLKKLKKDDKKVFLEFQMGFSEKGYLDMCGHCYGADARKHPIPAAEQSQEK